MLLSVDGGRGRLALGLVDPFGTVVHVLLVLDRRELGVVGSFEAVATEGFRRPLLADDEVPEHFLGDEKAALDLGDRRRRCLEDDDVVRALAISLDGVGQPSAVISRVVRSTIALIRSSGASGRSTSMSS